jgi:hypothetical protein
MLDSTNQQPQGMNLDINVEPTEGNWTRL